jgi:hypothetical protein
MCFYEPFHEVLARCNPKRIRRDTYSTWNSRHPPLDRPYRDEYLPLVKLRGMVGLRGLAGYHEDFSVARYFPSAAGIGPELRYLERLLSHASRAGKRAVFGFSRSLARSVAIKAALGGYHIVVRRDPVQQWLSCRSYRVNEGSAYFELCHFLILALATEDSPASRFAQQLGLPRPPPGRFREQFDFLQSALGSFSDELSYRAFLGVHLLSYAIAQTQADLIIDLDRLEKGPQYRETVRTAIFARTGLTMSFRDCRVGRHDPASVALSYAGAEREVRQALRRCGAPV